MDPILQIDNLSISFSSDNGEVQAVKGVSFDLERSKTLGIVGESGSGKSVTALSIMKLIPEPPGKINSGKINYSEKNKKPIDLLSLNEKELRAYRGKKIAMIFQEPMTSLNPVFRCGNQMVEAIRTHQMIDYKDAKNKVIDLFKEVRLPDPEEAFYKYPHQLSGGQKQRVMIAMAMSCNPSILIADEPTTALDVTVQKDILKLVKSLQEKHDMTVIFISHDLGVISEIADDVIVMYKGEIVESDSVKQIFEEPQHPYTKGLIACRPTLNYPYKKLPTINDYLTGNIENLKKEFKQEKADPDSFANTKTILEINNLKTYFPLKKGLFSRIKGYTKAVDDISFQVKEGETFGLVGESGCGKTTLGRTILRLIEPTAGDIVFEDKDIKKLSLSQLRKMRKNMQIIFQDPYSSLNPRISVGNAIEEPLKVHGIDKGTKELQDNVNELLEKVGLDESYYGRYPHELSGGQRQRICIARALAVNPRFIVCDESVSALDVSVQAQILNLLNDLKKELGLTYIFISHDLSVVKFMSDRMMVMKEGKMMEMGRVEEIYDNPKTEYTKRLIEAIPGEN